MLHSGDIEQSWLEAIQQKIAKFNSQLISFVISEVDFPLHQEVLNRNPPLTQTSFYRYFIPEWIQAERVLYLDTDIIVDGSLLPLFEMEFVGFPIYAVFDTLVTYNHRGTHHYEKFTEKDPYTNYQGGEDFTPHLNSGVLLLDVETCKAQHFTQRLILTTRRYNRVRLGDQDILNFVFLKNWLELGLKYNYQVGTTIFKQNKRYLYPVTEAPTIIHYTGSQKPWLAENRSATPYHERYWHYQNKRWDEIACVK